MYRSAANGARDFQHVSTPTLEKLYDALMGVVREATPDKGSLTCALMAGLVNHELTTRRS